MNWSEPRKNFKSTENQINQRISTTCLNTPPQNSRINQDDSQNMIGDSEKQCPYHFGSPSHICLTCRRSICLRCAITYCQQHTIHPEQEILPLLLVDLQKLTIEPRIQDIELKLKQSQERQEYMSKKISKMLSQIEQNFQHIKLMLERKKQKIIEYFHEQLANKYLSDYKKYDNDLYQILSWLREAQEVSPNCTSIEELDNFAKAVKKKSSKIKKSDSSQNLASTQKTPTFNSSHSSSDLKKSKNTSKNEKINFQNIWSEEKLERVLFQIENISFKFTKNCGSSEKLPSHKKKRVTTEISEQQKISPFFSGVKNSGAMVKSGSSSRFNTGRRVE